MRIFLLSIVAFLCFTLPIMTFAVLFPSDVVRVHNESTEPIVLKIYDHEYTIKQGNFFRKSFRATGDGSYKLISAESGMHLANIGYFTPNLGSCYIVTVRSIDNELVVSDDVC